MLACTWWGGGGPQLETQNTVLCYFDTQCNGSLGARSYPACLFSSAGFPDHVPPPRGGDLPHHVLIREQHGSSGNLGHVSPRRGRRADRGERWMAWARGWSAEARLSIFTSTQPQSRARRLFRVCDLIKTPRSLFCCQMSHKQPFASSCALFLSTKAAKMANYAKCQILCNLLFAMFAILFISSRLGVYPVWWVLRLVYLLHHN